MFSYFGGGDKPTDDGSDVPAPVDPEDQPQTRPQIDANEQARLLQAVDSNTYVRRSGAWKFRQGMGLSDFLARCVTLGVLFAIAYFTGTKNPKAREDRKWLLDFTIVMLIWFTAIHALAYLPAMIFGSF